MAGDFQIDARIDTCGTCCPMPVLKTKKALATMQSGQVLEVLATDPASVADLKQFAAQTGHTVLSQEKIEGHFVHLIRKH